MVGSLTPPFFLWKIRPRPVHLVARRGLADAFLGRSLSFLVNGFCLADIQVAWPGKLLRGLRLEPVTQKHFFAVNLFWLRPFANTAVPSATLRRHTYMYTHNAISSGKHLI